MNNERILVTVIVALGLCVLSGSSHLFATSAPLDTHPWPRLVLQQFSTNVQQVVAYRGSAVNSSSRFILDIGTNRYEVSVGDTVVGLDVVWSSDNGSTIILKRGSDPLVLQHGESVKIARYLITILGDKESIEWQEGASVWIGGWEYILISVDMELEVALIRLRLTGKERWCPLVIKKRDGVKSKLIQTNQVSGSRENLKADNQ